MGTIVQYCCAGATVKRLGAIGARLSGYNTSRLETNCFEDLCRHENRLKIEFFESSPIENNFAEFVERNLHDEVAANHYLSVTYGRTRCSKQLVRNLLHGATRGGEPRRRDRCWWRHSDLTQSPANLAEFTGGRVIWRLVVRLLWRRRQSGCRGSRIRENSE
jgi:hypothetical protein